jgi:hypothetical protein
MYKIQHKLTTLGNRKLGLGNIKKERWWPRETELMYISEIAAENLIFGGSTSTSRLRR